jgi:hypothetical protein
MADELGIYRVTVNGRSVTMKLTPEEAAARGAVEVSGKAPERPEEPSEATDVAADPPEPPKAPQRAPRAAGKAVTQPPNKAVSSPRRK